MTRKVVQYLLRNADDFDIPTKNILHTFSGNSDDGQPYLIVWVIEE